jgi:hypothetical protein
VTADGTWTFGTQTNSSGNIILLNGAQVGQAQFAAYGTEMIVSGGNLYSTNTSGQWFVYDASATATGGWVSTTAPAQSGGSTGGTTPNTFNPCTNYYTSSVAAPTGYGASYDLFSSQHELEVVVDCSGSAPVFKVGSGSSSQYVYNKGYLYQSSSWQSINLTSSATLISNAWYTGTAQATLTNTNPTSWIYVVGYVCYWNGTAWQCGCANTACTTSYWQLQAFENQTSAGGGTSNGGSNGSGAGGQWGGTPDTNAIVISPNGNDGNPCTVSAPCQSLGRAQQAVQGASDKTVYLRAGTYGGTLALGGADNGETWMTYPGDAVDSAVIDCGGGCNGGIITLNGVSNITINGLSVEHFADYGIHGANTDTILIENCDVGHNTVASWQTGAIEFEGTVPNTHLKNNYIHDTTSQGTAIFDNWSGVGGTGNIDGLIIENSVYLRNNVAFSDGGGIYMEEHGGNTTSHSIIRNNFVRDYGAAGVSGQVGIYLDQGSNNVQITGNVVGPPAEGSVGTGNAGAIAFQDSTGFNNTYSGNIVDLGDSGRTLITDFWYETDSGPQNPTQNNNFTGNIIIMNFAGNQNTDFTGSVGPSYFEHPSYPTLPNISNNLYYNYGGGQVRTDGNRSGDSSPILNVDPQISGYLYTISAGSPVYSQMNFPHIVGGWGPPGFVIPSSSNHSDP